MVLPDNGVLKSTRQKKWFQKLMKKLPYRGVFNNVKGMRKTGNIIAKHRSNEEK